MVAIFADTDKMSFRIFLDLLAGTPVPTGRYATLRSRLSFALLHILGLFLVFLSPPASALEYVQFRHQGQERNEEGRIIGETPEKIAFESRAGQLYFITPEDLIASSSDEKPFEPYTKAEMLERLKNEFPASEGYHYLDMHGSFIIIYTTSRAFANWYGNLLDNLHKRYVEHWKRLGVELTEPKFPMVALVLSNEERYRQYAKQEGTTLSDRQCAYYHKLTNRIAMYDMSGQQTFQEGNQRGATSMDIQRFLAQPESYHNIMTAIHEAVHQVGYNTGMHPRYVPATPIWICEGLAIYHEVPDLRNRYGWTPGPHVNRPRLKQLRLYLDKPRLESPIQKMIQEDDLFRKPDSALDNYALAWGVTYFLAKRRPKELATYLKVLQEKTLDSDDSGAIRIKDFESCFGSDWDKFYKELFGFLRRL